MTVGGYFRVDLLHLWDFVVVVVFTVVTHVFSSSSVAQAYFLWTKGEKNNDGFGFAECPRSFIPREIRKFITWVPAEALKRGRKRLSFIFIHEALEGDGKGDWRLGNQAASQAHSGWWVPAASVDVRSGPCQVSYPGVLCIINAFLGHSLVCCGRSRLGSLISTDRCLFTAVTPRLPERGRTEQAQLEDSRLSGTKKNTRLVNFKLRGFVYVFSAPLTELVKF